MDRLSEENLRTVIASVEARALVPPEELTGTAREMFVAIAENNRSRPWGTSHAYALADYCRVSVAWREEMAEVEREGRLVSGKPNARLRVTEMPLDRAPASRQAARIACRLEGPVSRRQWASSRTALGASARRWLELSEADGGDLLA